MAKEQLAAEGDLFGASLAQQKELATLVDKTQNRQIDVSSAQGQNALLLELARIMGAKDLSSIPPEFLASIAKALGMGVPDKDEERRRQAEEERRRQIEEMRIRGERTDGTKLTDTTDTE